MKKKIKILLFILLVLMLILTTKTFAAIEIKPGTAPHTSITIDNAYNNCYNMRSPTSTLGNNTLDPHLALNKDWAAVAYLGLSAYGAINSATGPTTTISENSYYTTNGNASGVLNFGTNSSNANIRFTYVAAYAPGARAVASSNILRSKVQTKYVDSLPTSSGDYASVANTKAMALGEIRGWKSSKNNGTYSTAGHVTSVRENALGYTYTIDGSAFCPIGDAFSTTTYRPAIWN